MSAPIGFPRTLVHEGLSGGGAPLVVAGKIDDAIAAKYARFSMVCLQPGFLYMQPQRAALDAIRALNPQIKIGVHFVAHTWWGTPGADDGYQSRYAAICSRLNGSVPGTKTPNIVDTETRKLCIDLWTDVLRSGAYQFAMLDPMCAGYWPNGSLDVQRAALGDILSTLRRRFPSMIIIGCGGPGMAYPGAEQASGWWAENWPNQNPTGWSAVTRLCMDASFRYHAPSLNVIAMARSSFDPQAARFGLGTSCLFDGVFAYGPPDWKGSAHLDWVCPESEPIGWLGAPIGAPWPGLSASTWSREFEHGSVTVDTIARDARFLRSA